MRTFTLDTILTDAQRTEVCLLIQDGGPLGIESAVKYIREAGHQKIRFKHVRQWANRNVFKVPKKKRREHDQSLEYSQYLDALERMQGFCAGRDLSFRAGMRKAIDEYIGRLS